MLCLIAQSCPTLCDPVGCSPPGSSDYGIFQARILEWVAMPSPRASSQPRDGNRISCIGRQIPYYQHHLKSPPREGKTGILPNSALRPVSKNQRIREYSWDSDCVPRCHRPQMFKRSQATLLRLGLSERKNPTQNEVYFASN